MVIPAVAMDEEAKKRNTDCVYFLASPLTCKKGNNCEFRHSEAARMNPRDCWYWIHSTCRNPNCSFRHPPLEGKPGTSVAPQSAMAAPLAPSPVISATSLASKSKTPCYFFSQGNCTKGDKCPFLHGSALPTSADAKSQLKPSKAPEVELPTGNKPLVVLKSVASNAIKSTISEHAEEKLASQNDSQPVGLKAFSVSAQEKPHRPKAAEQTKASGSLETANPNRIEKAFVGQKSRVTLFSDGGDDFMNLSERDREMFCFEKKQVRPGRKQQQLAEYEQEHLKTMEKADHIYQNGCKTDRWWKNGCPDLENDGADPSLYGGEGEYSPRAANRGSSKVFDDIATQMYKEPHNHIKEGFETIASNHRQPCYLQHREQKMQYESDFNGNSEHYPAIASGGGIKIRDGQRMVSDGCMSSIDLRDHLMKRRRDDRGHPSRNESLLRRDPSDMVPNTSPNQRCDDDFISKGPRSRALSRGIDDRAVKRQRHNGGASSDGRPLRTSPIRHAGPGRSPDRALPIVSLNKHSALGFSRNEGRERGRDLYAAKAASVSNVRSHSPASRSMKSEYLKEDASFSGPKSLAQIKAEKEAEVDSRIGLRLGGRIKDLEEDAKLMDAILPLSVKQQATVASTPKPKRLRTSERAFAGKKEHKPSSSDDFEGPKPLCLLLKEKHKVGSGIYGLMGTEGLKKSDNVSINSNREVEDGEVRDEEDDCIESRKGPMWEESAPVAERDSVVEVSEVNRRQGVANVSDDMGSSEDEMGLEFGQIMSGDEDYELDDDDDDEDDFAKKLGGMYS